MRTNVNGYAFACLGQDASTIEQQINCSATFFGATLSTSGAFTSTIAASTNAVRIKQWRDGTNKHVDVNGTVSSAADTNSNGAANAFSIGVNTTLANGFSTANVALVLLCSAKPSVGEERNLDGFIREYYSVG